ncbi:MAG: SDR family oxidoreductase [Bacillota bacterium]
MNDYKPLKGQVGFVTGAGRGLGRGGAIMMGKFGAKVALVARTRSELEKTRELVEAEGGEALVLPVDLRDSQAVIDALDTTEKELGPVTALVNNAAVLDLIPFEETDPDIWYRAFDVNIHAAYHAIRHVYPKMVQRGDGSIHNVSSAAGFKGFINESAYCSTKFALEGLSKALALEAMPHNILVTMSSPGIRTKPTSITMEDLDELSEDQVQQWADPVVMGEAFAYLAYTRDLRLAARRYDLYRVSELVRENGSLDLDVAEVISCSRE